MAFGCLEQMAGAVWESSLALIAVNVSCFALSPIQYLCLFGSIQWADLVLNMQLL